MAKKDRYYDSKKLISRTKKSQKRAKGRGRSIIDQTLDIQVIDLTGKGSHSIDIIPYIAGKHDEEPGEPAYTFEYFYHRNIGPNNAWVICLAETFGLPCPICEDRQRKRERDEEGWKDLWPKRRNLYNIICYDRGEGDKGIQVLDISWHYLEKHLAKRSDKKDRRTGKSRTINFSSPKKKEGKTITFEIEPPKGKEDYAEYLAHDFEDRDYDISKRILKDAYILDEIIVIPTYEDVEEIYYGASKKKSDIKEPEGLDELLEELEDLDEMEDLEEFVEDQDIDIKIKKKHDEDDVKEMIEKALKEKYKEEEEEDDEPKYSEREIMKLKKSKLRKIIEKEDLDVDPDDDDFDDIDDLRDAVLEALEEEDLVE